MFLKLIGNYPDNGELLLLVLYYVYGVASNANSRFLKNTVEVIMKRVYKEPKLTVYGSAQSITGYIGPEITEDVGYNSQGEQEQDEGTLNTCPTDDDNNCL